MIKTYIFLIAAIFCEVAGTMLLPVSQNFTKVVPTVALSIFYLCAFYLLTFVVNKLTIAIVYATWSGLGIFTKDYAVFVGILHYFEADRNSFNTSPVLIISLNFDHFHSCTEFVPWIFSASV